jgi:hypothetical protein
MPHYSVGSADSPETSRRERIAGSFLTGYVALPGYLHPISIDGVISMEWWQIQELMITAAVIAGVLIPVFALTNRFLVQPARKERNLLQKGEDQAAEAIRDERLDNMERQLEALEESVRRLVDVTEFDRQLKSGKPDGPKND